MKLRKKVDIPITGPKCVSMLITDHGVFEFRDKTVFLKEISKNSSVDRIRSLTDVDLTIPSNVPFMEDNFSKYAGKV
jgi:acetate CoA/acetoacetate CoA-transferase beta subunit